MTKLKNLIIIFFFVSLLNSCEGTKSVISFEILEPAAITYPTNVKKIGYLNRSPLSFTSFEQIDVQSLNDTDLYMLDTMISRSMTRGFEEGKSVTSLPYMDSILYLTARKKDTLSREALLPKAWVMNICHEYNLDALISFDYYIIKIIEFINYNIVGSQMLKDYVFVPEVRWTLYIPEKEEPLDIYTFNDTLYFVSQDTFPSEKYLSAVDMIRMGVTDVGYTYGIRNVPVWNEITRIVFVGYDKELRLARSFTDKGDWDSAMNIWEMNLASEDVRMAAKSAHNLAVYYELEDDLVKAMEYSKKANSLWPSPRIEFYTQELEIRLLNKMDIYKQVRISQ